MVIGRRYWILIWYGILLLGVLGLWASVYWGRQTRWKNLDELLRAIGTITVSTGMLFLLHGVAVLLGQLLLLAALACFITAFVYGRRHDPLGPRRSGGDEDGGDEPGKEA
jgi:hypothetical protein